MNHRLIFTFSAALLIILCAACNVNDGNGTGLGRDGSLLLDSGATITTHSETHSESNTDFELKGGIHSESHSTTHTTTTSGKQAQPCAAGRSVGHGNFRRLQSRRNGSRWRPIPSTKARKTRVFKRLRMKNPITNSYGKGVYPRVLMKGYRFIAPSALTKDVEEWLNSLGSATKGIQLGQAVKSSRRRCFVLWSAMIFWLCRAVAFMKGQNGQLPKSCFLIPCASMGLPTPSKSNAMAAN